MTWLPAPALLAPLEGLVVVSGVCPVEGVVAVEDDDWLDGVAVL